MIRLASESTSRDQNSKESCLALCGAFFIGSFFPGQEKLLDNPGKRIKPVLLIDIAFLINYNICRKKFPVSNLLDTKSNYFVKKSDAQGIFPMRIFDFFEKVIKQRKERF